MSGQGSAATALPLGTLTLRDVIGSGFFVSPSAIYALDVPEAGARAEGCLISVNRLFDPIAVILAVDLFVYKAQPDAVTEAIQSVQVVFLARLKARNNLRIVWRVIELFFGIHRLRTSFGQAPLECQECH